MLDRRSLLTGALSASLVNLPGIVQARLTAKHGFNDAQIDWKLFDEGRDLARREGRPIFFLAHATWCPHCVRYRDVFFDPSIVQKMQAFVPILLDMDQQSDVSARYAPDGEYVPRTLFLNSEARLVKNLRFQKSRFNYFVDYSDPRFLRRYMTRASRVLG